MPARIHLFIRLTIQKSEARSDTIREFFTFSTSPALLSRLKIFESSPRWSSWQIATL